MNVNENYKCINGFILKMIAILTMLTDHIGAVLFPGQMLFRYIGRIAFPIFIFLLVEGFLHTRNIRKYELRLFLFALISEIPFDLAFDGVLVQPDSQNVFVTLFLGLLMLDFMQQAQARISMTAKKAQKIVIEVLILLVFMIIANLLETDYSAGGILLIWVFYRLRGKNLQITVLMWVITGFFFGAIEWFCLIAMVPIALYNGERGFSNGRIYSGQATGAAAVFVKWAFYLFYPVHLLILHFISVL